MSIRFVKFEFDKGEPIWINPAQVTTVQRVYGDNSHVLIRLTADDSSGWVVPGTVGEVLEKLKFK